MALQGERAHDRIGQSSCLPTSGFQGGWEALLSKQEVDPFGVRYLPGLKFLLRVNLTL